MRSLLQDLNGVIVTIVRRMAPNITQEQGEAMKTFSEIVHRVIFSKLDD